MTYAGSPLGLKGYFSNKPELRAKVLVWLWFISTLMFAGGVLLMLYLAFYA